MRRVMQSILGRNAERGMARDLISRAKEVERSARVNYGLNNPNKVVPSKHPMGVAGRRFSSDQYDTMKSSIGVNFRSNFLVDESNKATAEYESLKASRKSPDVGETRPSRGEVKQAKTYAKVAGKVASRQGSSPSPWVGPNQEMR